MAEFRKIGTMQAGGFNDVSRYQIMMKGGTTSLFLFDAGGWTVSVDHPDIAKASIGKRDVSKDAYLNLSKEEKNHVVQKVDLIAGNKIGQTMLRATSPDGRDKEEIAVYVNQYSNLSMIGKAIGDMTPEMRTALRAIPLRDAVIAVAMDQMYGKASKEGRGFGYYGDIKEPDGSDANWCGEFCVWCWAQALHAHGMHPGNNALKSTMFTSYYNLSSPQQAISWAMLPETRAQLLRYSGKLLIDYGQFQAKSPMSAARKKELQDLSQEYREIGWNGNNLERGDIILVRDSAGKWKHVCMIDSVDGTSISTLEGNVYGGGSFEPGKMLTQSIARLKRERDERVGAGYKYVYVHLQP
jgi:hypothetical protein